MEEYEYEVTLPSNEAEWYAKGMFVDEAGESIYFEIPAIFNEGSCDEQQTRDKINTFIDRHNRIHTLGSSNGTEG